MRFATREAGWPAVLLSGAILVGAIMVAIGSLPARAADPYQVTGVPIDATADSAATARDRALAEGQRRALERLFDRLVDPADRGRVTLPDAATISSWVAAFEVDNERRSAVRYLARLTVIFADQSVRDYFQRVGVVFADTPSPPILVLPVLQQGSQQVLGGVNPWRAAWQTGTVEGLAQFALPGDPADPADAITPAQAAAADDALLDAVEERYSVSETLVAHLTEPAAGEAASLRATWLGPVGRGRTLVDSLSNEGDNASALYQLAVQRVAKWVEDAWRNETLVRAGEAHDFEVTLPLKDIADWVAARDGLARVTSIQQVEVLSFSRHKATVRIQHRGSPEQLTGAMAAQGLNLAHIDDRWEISVVPRARAAGGQR